MTPQFEEARLAVQKAREALRNNNHTEARKWAEHAASLAPQMEDPWLVLAAIASPRASVEYIQRALKINPNSLRARKGMEWAQSRLHEISQPEKAPENGAPPQSSGLIGKLPKAEFSREQFLPAQTGPSTDLGTSDKKSKSKRSPLYPILLFVIGLFVCAIVAWAASASPALALLANSSAPTPTHPSAWAQAQIAKPTYTPSSQFAQTVSEPAFTPTPAPLDLVNNLPADLPTDTPADIAPAVATDAPTAAPTELAAPAPQDNSTPTAETPNTGGLSLAYVDDTPTLEAPTAAPAPTPGSGSQTNYVSTGGERWIDVNLSQQMVYAYEGGTVVNSFLASTGTWEHPTVTGKYHIYVKYRYTDMAGPGYYLPNVPYTMYFYQGYGLHGTYWHHNFGTPMSHGCVNLQTDNAGWLFNWASVGTLVNVHY